MRSNVWVDVLYVNFCEFQRDKEGTNRSWSSWGVVIRRDKYPNKVCPWLFEIRSKPELHQWLLIIVHVLNSDGCFPGLNGCRMYTIIYNVRLDDCNSSPLIISLNKIISIVEWVMSITLKEWWSIKMDYWDSDRMKSNLSVKSTLSDDMLSHAHLFYPSSYCIVLCITLLSCARRPGLL